MESSGNCDLPADVILEILLRLPVKTLLRFKSVCKDWYTLIESPSFVNRHFAHESNQDRLLVQYYKPNEDCYAFALYVDEILSVYEEPDHLQMPDTVDDLLGPVNGVFCLVGQSREMALLNLAMRQFKPLPLQLPDVQPHLCSVVNVLGFGMDPLSGDYKIVGIHYFWNGEVDGRHDSPIVSVYNSGIDSWRHFEDGVLVNSSHCARRSPCNTYLDGVYYWLMEFDSANVAAVLAFDMTTEKFQEIQVPDCIKSKKNGQLALYGDSIALLSYDKGMIDKCHDIWVMETEGCWTKISTVGPFQDVKWPLCLWKNNELLLEESTSPLTLYNFSTEKLRTIEAQPKEDVSLLSSVFSYKESLVSIRAEGDDCMLWDAASDFVKCFLGG